MGSMLRGRVRKLRLDEFKGPQPSSNPHNMLAECQAGFTPSGVATKSVGSGKTQAWQLADTVIVDVTFDGGTSWVLTSVANMTPTQKDRILNHEQGHYNIVALLARDMFIELMQLKNARLASSADVAAQARAIHQRYSAVAQPTQDVYDSKAQTDHGRDATKQAAWDGYIQTAFTQARSPAMSAPDGATYKVELLEVLRQNGIVP